MGVRVGSLAYHVESKGEERNQQVEEEDEVIQNVEHVEAEPEEHRHRLGVESVLRCGFGMAG